MSVLIKGMEMPDNCGQCFVYDTTYRVCNLYFMGIPNRMTSLEHRPEWCELVELQSHGRLIDADDIFRSFPELIPYEFAAPTIIPTEEGE